MTSSNRLCPFCVAAVIGTVFAVVVPELAAVPTPFGKASLLMIWIPTSCALLRQAMLRLAADSRPR